MTNTFEDIFYKSFDGLTLYARDYDPGSLKPVVLCLHGLTRNSRDFHDLARGLTDDYRVISADQRGRGRSESDPNAANYRPDTYCEDMFTLLEHLKIKEITAIGTSMGGIMTMMMETLRPGLLRAAIINDIGPEINPAGLERIKSYVGGSGPFKSWNAAAKALKAQGPDVFPDYTDEDWIAFAQRTCTETGDGDIEFSYDTAIAKPFKHNDTAPDQTDLWPVFDALSRVPVLSIRGALSDILSSGTVEKMRRLHPDFISVEIPYIGHAPMLNEPESLQAIQSFLKAKL